MDIESDVELEIGVRINGKLWKTFRLPINQCLSEVGQEIQDPTHTTPAPLERERADGESHPEWPRIEERDGGWTQTSTPEI